jgi:hypothetical protein
MIIQTAYISIPSANVHIATELINAVFKQFSQLYYPAQISSTILTTKLPHTNNSTPSQPSLHPVTALLKSTPFPLLGQLLLTKSFNSPSLYITPRFRPSTIFPTIPPITLLLPHLIKLVKPINLTISLTPSASLELGPYFKLPPILSPLFTLLANIQNLPLTIPVVTATNLVLSPQHSIPHLITPIIQPFAKSLITSQILSIMVNLTGLNKLATPVTYLTSWFMGGMDYDDQPALHQQYIPTSILSSTHPTQLTPQQSVHALPTQHQPPLGQQGQNNQPPLTTQQQPQQPQHPEEEEGIVSSMFNAVASTFSFW